MPTGSLSLPVMTNSGHDTNTTISSVPFQKMLSTCECAKYIIIYYSICCGDKTRYATIASATAKSSIADVLRRPCGVARKRNAVLHLECGQARSIAIAATAASKASVTQ